MSVKFDLSMCNPSGNDLTIHMPKEIADGKIEQFVLEEGILLHKLEIKPKVDLEIENKFESSPILSLTSFLDGEMLYKNKEFNFEKHFKPNIIDISTLNYENGSSFYQKDVKTKAYHLVLTSQFIQKHLLPYITNDDIHTSLNSKEYFFKLLQTKAHDFTITNILQSLENIQFQGGIETFYIQSKIYELIYNLFSLENKQTKEYISQEDIKYLKKAHDFILNNLDKELSLKKIAKIAKTNENKLQKNFKIYFDKTVFDFILDCKMKKAKELLTSSDYNVASISQMVGYKHQSNFSLAFSKKYKTSPKELIKSRKYYY